MSDAKATQPVTATERTRVNFGKIPEVMELPNLISVQKESFDRFMTDGLREAFKESSPIQSQNHILEVTFGEHQFGDPAHTVEECREKDMTYQLRFSPMSALPTRRPARSRSSWSSWATSP